MNDISPEEQKRLEAFEKKADRTAWLIVIGFILATILCFLSSPRPAGAALTVSDVQQGSVPLFRPAPWWVKGDDPVPYQYWDTSTWLNGWYDMMGVQLALGVYLAQEELEKKQQLEEIRSNPPDKWFWYSVAAFWSIIAAGCLYADKLFAAGKRVLTWSKT